MSRPHLAWVTAGLCAYEALAIVANSPRIPTITRIQERHHVAGLVLVAVLAGHFIRADRRH